MRGLQWPRSGPTAGMARRSQARRTLRSTRSRTGLGGVDGGSRAVSRGETRPPLAVPGAHCVPGSSRGRSSGQRAGTQQSAVGVEECNFQNVPWGWGSAGESAEGLWALCRGAMEGVLSWAGPVHCPCDQAALGPGPQGSRAGSRLGEGPAATEPIPVMRLASSGSRGRVGLTSISQPDGDQKPTKQPSGARAEPRDSNWGSLPTPPPCLL